MTSINLPQSNTAALPPPAAGLAILSPSTAVSPLPSPLTLPPEFSQLDQIDHAPASPRPAAPLIRWRLPEDAGACLGNSLSKRWENYCKQLRACRRDFSESHVHQLRVATRRLMTQLILLSRLTSGEEPEKAVSKLKRRLKSLGELRDTHVQRLFVEERLEQFPELAPLRDFLERRQRKLTKNVSVRVLGLRTRKLKKWTGGACRELTSTPEPSEALTRQVFQAVAAAYEGLAKRRAQIDIADSETIHCTRVAFKKFRYMVEALSPEFTGLGKQQLERLATYQRRMGDVQDCEVRQALLTEFLGKHPGLAESLKSFSRQLAGQRARALRSYLKHADDLFAFAPAFESRSHDDSQRRAA